MSRKELAQLVQSLKAEGLVTDTSVTNGGHLRLHLVNGRSYVTPRTPGDRRAVLNIAAGVRRALRPDNPGTYDLPPQPESPMPTTETLHRPEPIKQTRPTGPRSRIVAKVVTRYTTSDGREFDGEAMALEHQRVVDFADAAGADPDIPTNDPIALGEWLLVNPELVKDLLGIVEATA